MVKALLCKLGRDIAAPFRNLREYVSLKLRFHGILRFNRSVRIGPGSSFEGADSIGDGSRFTGHMGYGSYMMTHCDLTADIGRFCSIGHEVMSTRGIHPYQAPFATTSPMFYSLRKQAMETFASEQRFEEIVPPTKIGNDCWIGSRVFLVGGISVGDGAVVLSGAVVTKDVPPYAVVGGVPAKVIKYRYDDDTIAWLLRTRWWDMPIEWLRSHAELLCDIEKLKKELNENQHNNG